MATAEDKALAAYLPTVQRIARIYDGFGVPAEDLVQEGMLAFVLAYRAWQLKPSERVQFSTRANFKVRDAMRQLIGRVRVGPRENEARALRPRNTFVSLTKHTRLAPVTPASQEEDCDRASIAAEVRAALAEIPERDRRVIELRFGEERTLQSVADELEVTPSRVHQIESRVLRQLSKRLQAVAA